MLRVRKGFFGVKKRERERLRRSLFLSREAKWRKGSKDDDLSQLCFWYAKNKRKPREGDQVAKPKYKKEYAQKVVDYFLRFIEMRDDPKGSDKANRQGMITVEIGDDGNPKRTKPPCSGYPSLTKFAILIGVTPRTLTNWRQKEKDFDEACEFADLIQDEVLNERALTGDVDGRVAMKIRELKTNAKKSGEIGGVGGLKIEIHKHISEDDKLELKEWEGEVVEDTGYTSEN